MRATTHRAQQIVYSKQMGSKGSPWRRLHSLTKRWLDWTILDCVLGVRLQIEFLYICKTHTHGPVWGRLQVKLVKERPRKKQRTPSQLRNHTLARERAHLFSVHLNTICLTLSQEFVTNKTNSTKPQTDTTNSTHARTITTQRHYCCNSTTHARSNTDIPLLQQHNTCSHEYSFTTAATARPRPKELWYTLFRHDTCDAQ